MIHNYEYPETVICIKCMYVDLTLVPYCIWTSTGSTTDSKVSFDNIAPYGEFVVSLHPLHRVFGIPI